jgi:hemolysin III
MEPRTFLSRTVSAHLHAVGLLLAATLTILLCIESWDRGLSTLAVSAIYGLTACLVFSVSSVYHYWHDGFGMSAKVEKIMESLDHASIYLFIAGTYTAVTSFLIFDDWKYPMLAFVWGMAALGIAYTYLSPRLPAWARSRVVYTGLFVLLGWSFFVKAEAYYNAMQPVHVAWLVAGGLFYTIGALVYVFKTPNPLPRYFGYHEIWHLSVLFGWLCHAALVVHALVLA